MKKLNHKEHIWYYVFIVFVMLVGTYGITHAQTRQDQLILFVLTDLSYVLLGLVHHFFNHDITLRIVVEYMLIGILGFSIFLLFFQSVI